jgi:hypothetical protein
MYLDANGAARKRDAQEPGPGYRSFGGPGVLPTGGLGGWAPGAQPHLLPAPIGKFLRKGSDLVLQIHYHPSGKPETDRSMVGVYFTKEPAKTIVGGLAILNHRLYVPAGEKHQVITAQSEQLPVDVNVLGLGPHMHLLGRQMKVTAETPTGEIVPMIWIKDWDFNWQGAYGYQKPLRLPKGSVIRVEAIYDNSADNPHNPSSPPKDVRWGEQTTDEMCLLSVQVTTDTIDDLREITKLRSARLGGALAGGVETSDLDDPTGKSALDDKPVAAALVDTLVDEVLDRGFEIPAAAREVLRPFDKNGDQKMSRDEFDAVPAAGQDRIRTAIRDRVRAAVMPGAK